jgi:hypothetical protein
VVDVVRPLALEVEILELDGQAGRWSVGNATAAHHEVRVDGLREGAEYRYQVRFSDSSDWVSEDRDGRPLSLRMPPETAGNICVALLADSQGGSFDEALDDLAGKVDSFQSSLFLGDLVAVGAEADLTADGQYLDYLLGPLSLVTAHVPLYTALGNHDSGHSNDPDAVARAIDAYRRFLVLPENNRAAPELVYSFDIGPVHVAVLDSIDRASPRSAGMLTEEQLVWLAEDASLTDRPWRVVALHHMVYGWQAPSTEEQQAEWFHIANFAEAHERFREAGVDLVLNGHRHAFNSFVKEGVVYVTIPPLSRDQVLFDRYGFADYRNLGGDEGTFERAFGEVFGYGVLCATPDEVSITVSAYDGAAEGLLPVDVPGVTLRR